MKHRSLRRLGRTALWLLLSAMLLGGCADFTDWHTKNIAGYTCFPDGKGGTLCGHKGAKP